MNAVGLPELTLILLAAVLWFVPVAAAIWALITLYRIRADQQAMVVRLDAIERQLRRPAS